MTGFYIALFPPNCAILHTIFRSFTLYSYNNYNYYATAISPDNYSYMA